MPNRKAAIEAIEDSFGVIEATSIPTKSPNDAGTNH
jgi:hypothetical protein